VAALPSLTVILLLLVLAACNAATSDPVQPAAGTPEPPVATPEAGTRTPAPTDPPAGAPTPDAASATGEPESEPTPHSLATPGPAARCAGSAENQDFFLAVAEAVDWTVLCPVLPDGWFVETGTYRLAGGGWLEIAYRRGAQARLQLREGAFCPDTAGCVPGGVDADLVPVGPLEGTLVATDAGGWAAVVDRGAPLSWLVEGSGMDEETFRAIVGALAVVAA